MGTCCHPRTAGFGAAKASPRLPLLTPPPPAPQPLLELWPRPSPASGFSGDRIWGRLLHVGPFPSHFGGWSQAKHSSLASGWAVSPLSPTLGAPGLPTGQPNEPPPTRSTACCGRSQVPQMPERHCSQQNARFPPGPVAGFQLSLPGHMARSATPRDNVSTKCSVFSIKPTFR